jgi:DHA3 family tetracycline resistance protein-like MFS transporter
MLWPLPAYPVYYLYCLAERGLRGTYWTAAVYFYLSVVGLDAFRLVIVGTVLEVVILIAEVPTGIVADVWSRRLSVILGVALMGAGFAFDGLLAAFWATLCAQVIWGVGVTFISGAAEAWIADELPGGDLARVYVRGAQWRSAGALLGIGAGVALSYAGLALTMIASGAALLALAAFLVVVMPERGFRPTPRGARTTWAHTWATLREGVGVVRGSAALASFVGVSVFYGMASESFDRLWEVHLLGIGLPRAHGLTPVAWFGLVNAGGLLLSIVAAEALRRRLGGGSERALVTLLIVFIASIALGMAAFGLAGGVAAAIGAYWATILVRQLVPPIVNAWINRHIPSAVRATVLSVMSQADAAGQIAGGPIFGAIATARSTGVAMIAAGLTVLPGIPLLVRAMRERPSPARVEPAAP